EQVYTLQSGKVNLQQMGVQVDRVIRSNRSTSKTYYYHFVAPWVQENQPDDHSQWIVMDQSWAEDPKLFSLFWDSWKNNLQVVQIFDDSWMQAISIAADQHKIDISEGVSLLKPISSVTEEVREKLVYSILWIGVLILLWISFGILRFYAARKD
ncbi:MAG: hypothetical protein EB038_08310, partial [Cyclobacteriaceae bacterium]|nr:hypothetical protein [Cyclobacteriaceae bacterium]